MNNILFIQSYTSIFSLTPWRNSIFILKDKGYNCRIIQLYDSHIVKYKDNISKITYQVPYPSIIKYLLAIIKHLFNGICLLKIGDGLSYILKSIYIIYSFAFRRRLIKYSDIIIAGDPQSLIAAFLFGKNKKIIYWSLELYVYRDCKDFGTKLIKIIERWLSNRCFLVIEFSAKRAQILKGENKIDSGKILVIPNSQIGSAVEKRNYYYNDLYGIDKNKPIILHAGGLLDKSYNMINLINNFNYNNCVLIIHSRIRSNKINYINKVIYNNKKQGVIFIDDNPLPYNEIEKIYSSCDIGLMLHNPQKGLFYTNILYTDLSSGKMFNYIKRGKPLITTKLPGLKEFIEDNGIGICIETLDELDEAIKKILSNIDYYSTNVIKVQEKYRYELYHNKIFNYI